MALLKSNFENRLSFVEESRFFLHNHVWRKKKALPLKREPFSKTALQESTKMELHRELSYGQPNGSLRRAILALFFSQCGYYGYCGYYGNFG